MLIRAEDAVDRAAVYAVNVAAFGEPDEAELVDRLRTEGVVLASLVAVVDHSIVGYILFSRMQVITVEGAIPAVALAPMAVLPEYQRKGIGAQLIRTGLDQLRAQGESIVIVLGHPGYYPRFGFSAQMTLDLEHPFPPDAYMALELVPKALKDIAGKVKYPTAFGL